MMPAFRPRWIVSAILGVILVASFDCGAALAQPQTQENADLSIELIEVHLVLVKEQRRGVR